MKNESSYEFDRGRLGGNPNLNVDYEGRELREIWFEGGCFWGVEAYMSRIYGVADAVSGYANGRTQNPAYREVCSGQTGHAETVKVTYDPLLVDLAKLLKHFFSIIDPTLLNRQGNDVGNQYRTGIYYKDEADARMIRSFISREQKKYNMQIVTEVLPLIDFYPAEEYHQDYLDKNPGGYCHVDFSDLKAENAERRDYGL